MNDFHGASIWSPANGRGIGDALVAMDEHACDVQRINEGLVRGSVVLVRSLSFERAVAVFDALVEIHGLRDSYDAQMQYVVGLMAGRDPVESVAVTVNKRGPYQMVQAHAEGDTTAPLELFGLYCVRNSDTGGESVLSLIDQAADHSKLRAKEKAIVDRGLSPSELNRLRRHPLDAKAVIGDASAACRTLAETEHGQIIVRHVPLAQGPSRISGEQLVTYWDNVTVHDHAFDRHHHALLTHLGILHPAPNAQTYQAYMHVEDDSPWAPVDTDSGTVEETARLFRGHLVHKLGAGELLVVNNRLWTHAASNWPPDQCRTVYAMYA